MKNILIILIICIFSEMQSQVTSPPWPHFDFRNIDKSQSPLNPQNDPNWTLILNENFNTLNRTTWNVLDEQYQFPTSFRDNSANIWVSGGTLKLRATYSAYRGWPITAAAIRSDQTFGRNTYIEGSFRLQASPAAYPAFWLWTGNGNCSTSDYNEIDIMEYFGCWEHAFQNGVHYCVGNQRATGPDWNKLQGTNLFVDSGNSPMITNFLYETNLNNNGFHTYSALWQSDFISFYYDNILYKRHINNNIINRNMGITINNALGNANCNSNNPSYVLPTPANTTFPQTIEVDWVRVYQLNCDRNTIVTQIPNFNTFNWGVKRRYTLSNTATVPSNANVSLMAREWIDLDTGLEVPNNTTFSATIIDCQ